MIVFNVSVLLGIQHKQVRLWVDNASCCEILKNLSCRLASRAFHVPIEAQFKHVRCNEPVAFSNASNLIV